MAGESDQDQSGQAAFKVERELCFIYFFMLRGAPRSTLFPYTTLFRSTSAGVWDTVRALRMRASRRDRGRRRDRKSTRLNSSHSQISYAVFCLKKKNLTVSTTSLQLEH